MSATTTASPTISAPWAMPLDDGNPCRQDHPNFPTPFEEADAPDRAPPER